MKDIDTFVKNFTNEPLGEIVKHKNEYFFPNKMKIDIEPFSPGIPLGTQKKDFVPSAFLLELLSQRSSNKVFVNEKAEWLFLCGRDVFTESLLRDESTSKLFLVQNSKDENLGLGKKFHQGVKNVFDRGDFLRRER